jgi:hypothetical protein
MQFSPNKRRLIDNYNIPSGVSTRIYNNNFSFPPILPNINNTTTLVSKPTHNTAILSNISNPKPIYNTTLLNFPPLPNNNYNNNNKKINAQTSINIDQSHNHIEHNSDNNNNIIKQRRDNEKSKASLYWIQQKAEQLKQMFPDLKLQHRKAISLAGEEYRNENGTTRAKKLTKSKTKKKSHICPNCNYKF